MNTLTFINSFNLLPNVVYTKNRADRFVFCFFHVPGLSFCGDDDEDQTGQRRKQQQQAEAELPKSRGVEVHLNPSVASPYLKPQTGQRTEGKEDVSRKGKRNNYSQLLQYTEFANTSLINPWHTPMGINIIIITRDIKQYNNRKQKNYLHVTDLKNQKLNHFVHGTHY